MILDHLIFTRSWNKKKNIFKLLKSQKKFCSCTSLPTPPYGARPPTWQWQDNIESPWVRRNNTGLWQNTALWQNTKHKSLGVLKYTRWNTGLDTCYTVCHVFCEIHFNINTVELHYIDILNSHKRWSDSLWLTYKYTGGWNRLCIPLLPVTPLFTFSGLSDTQKSFSVISSWKCFLKWKNYSICHNTTH